ncbi:MAG: hypothetical protein QNL90_16565 [Gammaproteobacteria bacterium]|nr:hypothetical protein [Gammaproteobacteria bacterium]
MAVYAIGPRGEYTVAEFVEDEAILKHLQVMGVDYVQGFGFGKPRLINDT